MARKTKYPYGLASLVQTDEKSPVAQSRGTYLICLFFAYNPSSWKTTH